MTRGYLIDTNVISEPTKRQPDPNVMAWLQSVDARDLRISTLTIYEIAAGIAQLKRHDPERAGKLSDWFDGVLSEFTERTLPVNEEIALIAGHMQAWSPRPAVDTLIAATAVVDQLVVVTRNVTDFDLHGYYDLEVLNPWDLPDD